MSGGGVGLALDRGEDTAAFAVKTEKIVKREYVGVGRGRSFGISCQSGRGRIYTFTGIWEPVSVLLNWGRGLFR